MVVLFFTYWYKICPKYIQLIFFEESEGYVFLYLMLKIYPPPGLVSDDPQTHDMRFGEDFKKQLPAAKRDFFRLSLRSEYGREITVDL